MRANLNVFRSAKNFARGPAQTQIVPYTRQDLTKKWMGRISAKAKDTASQESLMKLSSLIDYYNKPADSYQENLDWDYWRSNLRTEGLVDKIKDKYQEFKSQSYNIDSIAQKSVVLSNKYDEYSLHLQWNYHLWMRQYIDNIHSLNSLQALGDFTHINPHELGNYLPGDRETNAGWRETGHYIRIPHYYENDISTIVRRQFRYSNRSWQPYWHSVSAWEKGFVIKHVLMSL